MLSIIKSNSYFKRAKASVGRTLPFELINRTRKILEEFGPMNITQFGIIYMIRYGENFDASAIGFDTGMIGFFQQLDDMVKIVRVNQNGSSVCKIQFRDSPVAPLGKHLTIQDKNYHESLLPNRVAFGEFVNGPSPVGQNGQENKENNGSQLIDARSTCGDLFDPANILLWEEDDRNLHLLLEKGHQHLHIPESPYEMAMRRSATDVIALIDNFRENMKNFPDGIPLNMIYRLVHVNKRLFNAQSIAHVVWQNPEIFFVLKQSEDSDEEPLVFPGKDWTYEDFDQDESTHDAKELAFEAIKSGIYQQTLLLIRKAGPVGLKLVVWNLALKDNFQSHQNSELAMKLLDIAPFQLAMALNKLGFIRMRSTTDSRNDLRLYLPIGRFVHKFLYAYDKEYRIKMNRMREKKPGHIGNM